MPIGEAAIKLAITLELRVEPFENIQRNAEFFGDSTQGVIFFDGVEVDLTMSTVGSGTGNS